ncbi:hypothetical protein [Tahibacter sp.]|uniref:hypothetical protein n=1 Tax=Tahibacter sp. TaxID=2056211 RepID=UPI0028C3D09E|nr:hypothetical protein [Tahibacter sp.]
MLRNQGNNTHWGNALVRHELGDVTVTYQHVTNAGGGGGLGRNVNVSYQATDRLGSPLGMMDREQYFRQRADNGTFLDTRRSFDAFGQTRESDFRARTGNAQGQKPYTGQLNLTPKKFLSRYPYGPHSRPHPIRNASEYR